MTRDELFIELALKTKLLTPAQIEDCNKLRTLLSQNSFALSLPEIVIRKEYLNPDQTRMINVAIRYEETRKEDQELGAFIIRKGFLPQDKVEECLASQEAPYREGRHFPRLQDLLVQKSYLSPQQVHVIQRAREQLDAGKARPAAGSSAFIPVVQPAVPPPTPPPAPPPPPPPSAAKGLPADTKVLMAGLSLPALKVVPRRMKFKDVTGREATLLVLDADGTLDAHTFRQFDDYLLTAMAGKLAHFILNCEKLDYVSSAGIGVLVGAVKRCRDLKGDLRLCGVQPQVKKVIDMIGLGSLLRIYENERGAVMSFRYT